MNDQVVIRAACSTPLSCMPLSPKAPADSVAMTLYNKVAEKSGFLVYRKAV